MESKRREISIRIAFFCEMEKIAFRAAFRPQQLKQMAQTGAQESKDLARALGWRRFIPGTSAGKAYRASVRRGKATARRSRSVLKGRRQQALATLGEPAGTKQQRQEALRYLQEIRQQGRIKSPNLVQRPGAVPPPQSSMGPVRKAALIGGGGVLAGGAGLYGLQHYAANSGQQDPYSGYR